MLSAEMPAVGSNLWGIGWSQNRYVMMPYEFILNSSMASDFGIIQSVG
jgi:hypothetical protein